LIAFVLACDPLRNGLAAFKAARRVEVGTLPAGMEFEVALRTLCRGFHPGWQQRATLCTAGDRARARHLQSAWPKSFLLDGSLAGLLLPLLAAVLITVLPIFSVGHETPSVGKPILSRLAGFSTSAQPDKIDAGVTS